jgi:energy-coupling factor transporter ATP-binding protein EcfA2
MAPDVSVNLADATPRRLLVVWANKQDGWLRALAAETILSRQSLPDAKIDELYERFLAEKRLSDVAVVETPLLEIDDAQAATDEALELEGICDIQGVNALAGGQSLELDPSLTVLFGQNGSGKTGYARILKRISAVRTPESILPNAHAEAGVKQPDPSARITYALGGVKNVVDWHNEPGLTPFTRISVFDAQAVSLHVDSDLGYVYTPAELALFSHVSAGIQRVQERITQEIASLRPGPNSLLSSFAKGTAVYALVETLGATTELAELTQLTTLEADAEEVRSTLEDEVNALRANTLDALLANATQTQRDLELLKGLLTIISTFDSVSYEEAVESLASMEGRRRKAREELFSQSELFGMPDSAWEAFIVAADEYRSHIGLDHYPAFEDACLYCMQPLGPAAHDLVLRYHTYLDQTLADKVTLAKQAADRHRLVLPAADMQLAQRLMGDYASSTSAPSWAAEVAALLEEAASVAEETSSFAPVTSASIAGRAAECLDAVVAAYGQSVSVTQKLNDDRTHATVLLATKKQELADLSSRLDLRKNLPLARSYVERAKRAQRLDQLSRDISSGAAKSLTVQSKLASEDLVNKNFEALFADECSRLRAPKVALTFQGRSGKAERKKVVASYKPSAVLSEGEQKVLAIADFLAESRMRVSKAPIVFDDPVTSLDYRRLEEVAARVQQLSESHQVIVLTHNVLFASALVASRQNKKQRVKLYEVRDGGIEKGVLAPDVEPRLDTPADLAKRVDAKILAAAKADPVVQDALICETYDLIRAWCEAFVEQELLQNVTQRYRANIMMTRLGKIDSSRLDAASAVITPLFDRACRLMSGHSQAAEYLNTKPTISELQADWQLARDARDAYTKK